MDVETVLLILIPGVLPLILAFLLRKRILRWFLISGTACAIGEFFDEEEILDAGGKKARVLRPNEAGGAFLKRFVPGMLDWAMKNVKITLPSFALPENIDLKAVGINVLAQKAMSGKRLKLDDAIPLVMGYAKDWAEKSGILESLGGAVGMKPKPGAKQIIPKELEL
jgi:hypothetical protein